MCIHLSLSDLMILPRVTGRRCVGGSSGRPATATALETRKSEVHK